ncbi:hypothetical protein AMOR_41750 [Anaeromyxobacter oryzae]|uniref:Uncharacterized protein n=1 Tax=Anaeromyxobacter oryzae TaxID=2918170 RepID=A0ABM7X066_9BACT|nr:hypothetical protein AMOR_41750 [Anaeromyxobacter oryzae]
MTGGRLAEDGAGRPRPVSARATEAPQRYGPRTLPDVAHHAALLATLVYGLRVAARRRVARGPALPGRERAPVSG